MDINSLDSILYHNKISQSSILDLSFLRLNIVPVLSEFTWVEKLNLSNNFLTKVSNLPPNTISITLSCNNISNIENSRFHDNLKELDISKNSLKKFDGGSFQKLKTLLINKNDLEEFIFPPNLINLDITDNKISSCLEFPNSLKKINCPNNKLDKIIVNSQLEKIDMSHNQFEIFPEFKDSIDTIISNKNSIKTITYLPSSLKVLKLNDNQIWSIQCQLPPGLIKLDLSDNMLTNIPELPTDIEEVNVSDNRINELGNIPESVKILDCSNNHLCEIPEELKRRNIKLDYDNNFMSDDDNDDTSKSFLQNSPPEYSSNDYGINKYQSGSNYPFYNNYHNYNDYSSNWRSNNYSLSSDYNYQNTNMTSDNFNIFSNQKAKKENPYYVSITNKKKITI